MQKVFRFAYLYYNQESICCQCHNRMNAQNLGCSRQRKGLKVWKILWNARFQRIFGRSGEAQTRGLRIPNAARYQLRYTPIVIQLWSCRWSNLWSGTVLTVIFCFPYRPKSARLKGFRRFSLLHGVNTVYAPKCGALSTALHPDSLFNCGHVSGQICGQTHFWPLFFIFRTARNSHG